MSCIELSHEQFFNESSLSTPIQLLLKKSLETKIPLTMKIVNDTVQISNNSHLIGSEYVYMKASPIINNLCKIKPRTIRQKINLPFLVDVEELAIPASQIISLSHCSLANSFIRNLFSASVRNCIFSVDQAANSTAGISSSMFRTHYYFYFKHMLPEEKLKHVASDIALKLLALNTYIDGRYFDRNLLNTSLDEFQQDDFSEN